MQGKTNQYMLFSIRVLFKQNKGRGGKHTCKQNVYTVADQGAQYLGLQCG